MYDVMSVMRVLWIFEWRFCNHINDDTLYEFLIYDAEMDIN